MIAREQLHSNKKGMLYQNSKTAMAGASAEEQGTQTWRAGAGAGAR